MVSTVRHLSRKGCSYDNPKLTVMLLSAGDAAANRLIGEAGARKPQAQAVELICRCDEIPDEKVELHILKALLTATTSTTFTVHGQASVGTGWGWQRGTSRCGW